MAPTTIHALALVAARHGPALGSPVSSTATIHEIFLWIVLPYVALTIFVVGHIGRYRRDQFGRTSRSTQLLESRWLAWGSNLFHYGALAVIGGHVLGLVIPRHYVTAAGLSEGSYHLIPAYAGSAAGLLSCWRGAVTLVTVARPGAAVHWSRRPWGGRAPARRPGYGCNGACATSAMTRDRMLTGEPATRLYVVARGTVKWVVCSFMRPRSWRSSSTGCGFCGRDGRRSVAASRPAGREVGERSACDAGVDGGWEAVKDAGR